MFKYFPFHKVNKSPWPVFVSFSVLGLLVKSVLYFHSISKGLVVFFFFFLVLVTSSLWWKDVLKESSLGYHKIMITKKFYVGMIILIISEVFFFSSFFWAFFHKCWSPAVEAGVSWPPLGMENIIVDSFSIPLLNTIILLSSGMTVTWAHQSILNKNFFFSVLGLSFTVILGFMFLLLQGFEYSCSFVSFKSMVYGSCFFMLTGFHGGHVMVGTIFLLFNLIRSMKFGLIHSHHVSLELAMWYWHFVDVVWLFLFIFVYWYTSEF